MTARRRGPGGGARPPGGGRPARAGRGARGRAGALALLSAALLAWACGGDDRGGPETLDDSVYVEVMARLVVLDSALSPTPDVASADRSRADSLRARILESWGVDADRLLDYARTRGGSPERMEAVWRRVHELSDSLAAEGWSPPDGPSSRDTAAAPGDTLGAGPAEGDGSGGATGDAGGAPGAGAAGSGPGAAPREGPT